MRTLILAAAVAALYVLHQDLWFWRVSRPFVFGILPVGLFYHALYSVACAGLMWALVRFAWPAELDDAGHDAGRNAGHGAGHPGTGHEDAR